MLNPNNNFVKEFCFKYQNILCFYIEEDNIFVISLDKREEVYKKYSLKLKEMYEDYMDKKVIEEFEKEGKNKSVKFVNSEEILKYI